MAGIDVHCTSVVHLYPMTDGDVVALRGFDLDVAKGEMVALLGASGSGKSTVLALLAGLLRSSAGKVLVGPYDVNRMSPRALQRMRALDVALVLQDASRNLLPYATAAENIWFAQRGAKAQAQKGQDPDDDLDFELPPENLLAGLGLGSLVDTPVNALSGGEQQRIALAAAAASGPRLLLVDEPTSQVDADARDSVLELLHEINRQIGSTVVTVTHDPAVAAAMPRTVTMRDGRVSSEGRQGVEYAVVGRDGSVHLPPDVLEILPPDTLIRIIPHAHGVDLRHAGYSETEQAILAGDAAALLEGAGDHESSERPR